MHLFSDYIIASDLRYEAHSLIYTQPDEPAIQFRGILAAAILGALIVDTDEGDARGVALDTPDQRNTFFQAYERETRRDNGGLLTTEVQALCEAYMEFTGSEDALARICRNDRLLDLAVGLTLEYMQRLVREEVEEHIYDLVPWKTPFAQWLFDAGYVETRRQHLLSIDWTDPASVYALSEELTNPSPITPNPLFVFEGEKAVDIMERYLQWLSDEYVAMKQEIPGAKITNADRRYILSQETDYGFLADDIATLLPDDQASFRQWMQEWETFLTSQLCPQEEIHFWVKEVPEELRDKLLDYLRLQERQPAHYQALTSAIYALRQLGYIPYKLGLRSMRQYLSDHLSENYMLKNTSSQFNRAWKEHGRYTPAVREQIAILAQYGIEKFSL